MMRILALDLGAKSCGIAWTDRTKTIAQGRPTFYYDSRNWHALINHLITNYVPIVELIVIGLPLLPSGDKSKTTLMVKEFRKQLELAITLPIQFVEESYTTKNSHEVMIMAGLSRQKRKQRVDQLAAVLILQRYLETRSRF